MYPMDFLSRSPSDHGSRASFQTYPSLQYSLTGGNSPQPGQPRRSNLTAVEVPKTTEETEEWSEVYHDLQLQRQQSMEQQSGSVYPHLQAIIGTMQKQLADANQQVPLGTISSAAQKERNFHSDVAAHPLRALQWVQGSWMHEDIDPNQIPPTSLEHALLTQPAVPAGLVVANSSIRIPQQSDCSQQGKNGSIQLDKVVLNGATNSIDAVDLRKDMTEEPVAVENQANMDYTMYTLSPVLMQTGTEQLEKCLGVDNDSKYLLQRQTSASEEDSADESVLEPLLQTMPLTTGYSNNAMMPTYTNNTYNTTYQTYNTPIPPYNNNNNTLSTQNVSTNYNTFNTVIPPVYTDTYYQTIQQQHMQQQEEEGEQVDMKTLARMAAEKAMKVTEERKKKGHSTAGTRSLPPGALEIQRGWLFANFDNPYPEETEKEKLAAQTGLTKSQVNYWMINARVRIWKPMLKQQQQKMHKNKKKKKE